MFASSDLKPCWYTNESEWPYEDVTRLYLAAAEENPVLAIEPDALERFHDNRHADLALLLLRDPGGRAVAGMLIGYGDTHIRSCLCVHAALVLPEYRGGATSRRLHRLYVNLARSAGINWLCTVVYQGGGVYLTRYRRLQHG